MALSIGESIDVNNCLRYLLGLDRDGLGPVDPDDACKAATRLADRAHRTLMAGLTADQVERAWPRPRAAKKGAR